MRFGNLPGKTAFGVIVHGFSRVQRERVFAFPTRRDYDGPDSVRRSEHRSPVAVVALKSLGHYGRYSHF